MKKPRGHRLGLLLLKGLRRKPKRRKSKSVPTKTTTPRRKASVLRTRTRPQIRRKKGPLPKNVPIAPETALVPVPPPSRAITLAPPPGPHLSSSDLIRPEDSLRQSIEAFLMDQRSPHTQRAYGKDLKRFVRFLHARRIEKGEEPLERIVLIAYKDSLLAEGLEHTTIDRHLATLRSFFRWMVEDGHLPKSPMDGVRFLNPKRLSRTVGFSDEEVSKILALPDLHTRTGSLHYAVLMILFYCGLRRSEVCALRTSNLGVERETHVIRLRGKGNSERLVVMIEPVWSALKHYFLITRKEPRLDQNLFTPIRNNRTGNLDKPIDSSMIFYIVTKYAKQAGVANRVSPHSCRATAISNARDHLVPDRAIQEFAGWASPDMITRYDKRKSSIEKSAAHAISYGSRNRDIPVADVPREKTAGEMENGKK